MALEATHIRFALDVRDLFRVNSLDQYLSGSIYPDSRYVSGIDRKLTHDKSQMGRNFWGADDFRKGWASHILYDDLQYHVHIDWFKDYLKKGGSLDTGGDEWVTVTALKILQEISDLQQFDIGPLLGSLSYINNPNNEDKKSVERFNQRIIDLYAKAPAVEIGDYEQMCIDWGLSPSLAKAVGDKAREIRSSRQTMQLVSRIYDETIARCQNEFDRHTDE